MAERMLCRGGAIPAEIDGEPVEIAYLSDNTLQSIRADHAEDYIDLTCLTAIEDQGEGLYRLTFAAGEWLLIDASSDHAARLLAAATRGRAINNAPAFSLLPPSPPSSAPAATKPGWARILWPLSPLPLLLAARSRDAMSLGAASLVAFGLVVLALLLLVRTASQRRVWESHAEIARRDHARYLDWFRANGLPLPGSDARDGRHDETSALHQSR